jgi:D-alanine transaminase
VSSVLVYLNGSYVDEGQALVPVNDRGFLFADGVYEVARVYDGRTFRMAEHLVRLSDGLAALGIADPGVASLESVGERLLEENDLRGGAATIYIQVTRGAAPRRHAFPDPPVPATVYVAARPFVTYPSAFFEDGVAAITLPDTRWSRCDIKSISLLPNVLANQQAHAAEAFEALFVRDGAVLEGSHSNLFGVYDGTLVTYPACNYILPGITRELVLGLADELGIPVRLGAIVSERLGDADELFLSGTTTEIMPVVRVDGRRVGEGRPGPVTRRLQRAFAERIAAPADASMDALRGPH